MTNRQAACADDRSPRQCQHRARRVDLPPKNTITTPAGGKLFDFGDKDGTGDAVRLQHPQGIATDGERVYIADTYNHRIKVLDPVERTVKTLAGRGKPGLADGRPIGHSSMSPAG